MDHHEQHHLHHEKEREHRKKIQKEHERQQEKNMLPIHPLWLLVIGIVLVLVAVLIWSFVVWPLFL
jgi:hypothetical protein